MAQQSEVKLLETKIRKATIRCAQFRLAENTERYLEEFDLVEALELQLKGIALAKGGTLPGP